MIITLPENLAAEIRARAEQQGGEPEAYAIGLLWRGLVELDPPKPKKRKLPKDRVASDEADHDWSDVFSFSSETSEGPSVGDLGKPVKVSDG